jgi:hopene-associated glycosyltransferase HpnB
VVVPARNEADTLPQTLPALLSQDYPGPWSVVLVDDRSADGTANVARALAGPRLTVVEGEPLPEGWVGKVWALEQGCSRAGDSEHVLLTDADIRHAPGSLRRLVAESEAGGLSLNSRMARLQVKSAPERLLIPAFVWFFNLLYPMRAVNDSTRRLAAAAGGCVLVRADALERAGGPASIAGAVIDDVSLAKRVKALGAPIRLSTSRSEVVSIREYRSVAPIWRMVRRTAFTELRHSWALLALTLCGLGLLFPLPVALVALGLAGVGGRGWAVSLGLLGATAWLLMSGLYLRAVRFFGLRAAWALALPLAGLLYGAMSLDSALRSARRSGPTW